MILYLCFNDFSMILEQVAYDFMISYVKRKQKEKKHCKTRMYKKWVYYSIAVYLYLHHRKSFGVRLKTQGTELKPPQYGRKGHKIPATPKQCSALVAHDIQRSQSPHPRWDENFR